MEKRTPHIRLARIRALVSSGAVRMTFSAVQGARSLGLDESDVLAVVKALDASDFRKSMTTHADHRVWQDVYCPATKAGRVYVKLTVVEELLVVSFKEA